tara:strand:+ start:944 stop:1507 length:564 start_codon:yes stop_codon:yes gene_type:complete
MTKINLRKSSAIQKELFQRVHAVEIDTDIEINEYNDPKQVIETQLKEVTDNIVYKQNLLSVLYSLRAKTGIVNAKWDVNKMLAEQERIKACINLYTNLCERKPRPDLFEVRQRIEKLKERGEESRYSRDSFSTSVFDKDDIKEFKQTVKTLKKNFQDLNDVILEVNVKRTIELSADEEKLLSDEGLL